MSSTKRNFFQKFILSLLLTNLVEAKLGAKSLGGTTINAGTKRHASSLWNSLVENLPSFSRKICDGETESSTPSSLSSISQSDSPSSSPTGSPTTSNSPTVTASEEPSVGPSASHSPTNTDQALKCPDAGDNPFDFEYDATNHEMRLQISDDASLCLLAVKLEGQDQFHYLARSYEGNGWEILRGPWVSSIEFKCEDSMCKMTYNDNTAVSKVKKSLSSFPHNFSLISFALEDDPASINVAARFLEQTTFGPTKSDLVNFTNSDLSKLNVDLAEWVRNQIYDVPPSSHRKRFRSHANTRVHQSSNGLGVPSKPCDPNSRWRSYAFTSGDSQMKDVELPLYLEAAFVPGSDDQWIVLSVDGVPRTEIPVGSATFEHWNNDGDKSSTIVINGPGKWHICHGSVSEYVDGDFGIVHPDSEDYNDCYMGKNPEIHFTSSNPAGLSEDNVINLVPEDITQFSPLPGSYTGSEFIHTTGLDPSLCDEDTPNWPLYLNFGDEKGWLAFDPRLALTDNTVENPNDTELGALKEKGAMCGNVPRTFLNEKDCVLTTTPSCRDNDRIPDVDVTLDAETIAAVSDATGRLLYSVEGLRPNESPCVLNTRSRWSLVGNAAECDASDLPDKTIEGLQKMLEHRYWRDGNIRDIWYNGDEEYKCDAEATTPDGEGSTIRVTADGGCWELMHKWHTAVFDFTHWVGAHPGGPDKITQFADNGSTVLTFPASHEMWRWEYNVHDPVQHVSDALGDTVNLRHFVKNRFLDIAAQDALTEALGLEHEMTVTEAVVCGSPNEVGTDLSKGETGLTVILGDEITDVNFGDLDNQKQAVWANVILSADDQLRQRMAWALSQIFAIDPIVLEEGAMTESFTNYYDIFVRHAFGNYYDVLKEVSYSPFMAQMLTYINSRSAAYIYEQEGIASFADENFAREVMQLFTIGTDLLNMDGTEVLNDAGDPILTYSNEHIMSFARAWTGFQNQDVRGNAEMGPRDNRIDPMKITSEYRDVFPKIDLYGGYIGDGYPLCEDMPSQSFLRKGAKYVMLGSSTIMESSKNYMEQEGFNQKTAAINLDKSSDLYKELCIPDDNGDCTLSSTQIVLDQNLPCYGAECEVDEVLMVRVTDTIFFEYVRLPCVEMSYYQDAKLISDFFRDLDMCANPVTEAAGEACCSTANDDLFVDEKNCQYVGEKMTFAKAQDRCGEVGKEQCIFEEGWCDNNMCCDLAEFPHWTTAPCYLKTKVQDETGYIAIVHETPSDTHSNIGKRFHADNDNFFPVHWAGEYPKSSNGCGGGMCDTIVDGCVCYTAVENVVVFNASPVNANDVISKLFVGSVNPDAFDVGYYETPIEDGDVKIYFRSGQSYDTDTVFEVNGVFYKNIKSNVHIVGSPTDKDLSEKESFSFRNPPHFMGFYYRNAYVDVRDAHYETDAVLQNYFRHPNVPPFLAIHFIQRFGISNPSLRYAESVATAFKDGTYVSDDGSITYGSGEYGDLGAMVAAIVLDREARSVVLDFDPTKGSLREPVLKVYGLMRSMEYTVSDFHKSRRYGQRLDNLTGKIGQMPHNFESIFSFFRRDFSPVGTIQQSTLVAPEAQRYTTPKVMGLLNGIFSLIKYGLNECHGGFGKFVDNGYWCGNEGDYKAAWGELGYKPEDNNNENIVNELATLMTAGRLNNESRQIIKNEIEKSDPNAGLRLAQQLIATTPEFHSTSSSKFNGDDVQQPEIVKPSSKARKAVVYLSLTGGMDSFNMIVPHSECSKDVYSEYSSARGSIGLDKTSLLEIDTGGVDQVCKKFGVHKDLPILESLYHENDLTFFANVGVLFEPVNKENWETNTPTQLFAHNIQQQDTQEVDPMKEKYGTGILGRMADALTAEGFNTGSFSIGGENFALIGELQKSPTVKFLEPWSVPEFNSNPSTENMKSKIFELNKPMTPTSGIMGSEWSTMLNEYVHQTEMMNKALSNVQQHTEFPNTHLGSSLKMVSSIMQLKDTLGNDRQFFFVESHGWDTHFKQLNQDATLIPALNAAIDAFVKEMKALGYWDDVVLVCTSEFGRTLTINSSEGSDHGWGGNYFILGGAVKNGKILGEYPDNLTNDGPLNIGRGRFIPTTSWDAIWNGVAEWSGITTTPALDGIMPNRGNFDLFTKDDLFV